jgi:cyclase
MDWFNFNEERVPRSNNYLMKFGLALGFVVFTVLLVLSDSPVQITRGAVAGVVRDEAGATVPATQSVRPELERIADGVYVWQRSEPPGLAVYANNVFIIRDSDVIVVDTDMRPTATREVIRALKVLTSKPVSHVINTHWHDDHYLGNAEYRAAYPSVKFVAHRSTSEDLAGPAATNRKGMVESIPPMLGELRKALAAGQNLAGAALSDEARVAHEADLAWGEAYVKEVPSVEVVKPSILVDDRLTLNPSSVRRVRSTFRGAIEILHVGPAHTPADLIVHLPAAGIVISGDVLIHPFPLLGNANFAGWIKALDRIAALKPVLIVPGHGALQKDLSYLTMTRELLADMRTRVSEQVARGATLQETRKAVNLSQWRTKFAGTSTHKAFMFSFYTAGPGIAAAYEELKKK